MMTLMEQTNIVKERGRSNRQQQQKSKIDLLTQADKQRNLNETICFSIFPRFDRLK